MSSLPVRAERPHHEAHQQSADQEGFRKAYEAMQAKDYPLARQLFLGLWKKARTYDVAAALARVEYRLENYDKAAAYTQFALVNLPPNEDAQAVEYLQRTLRELKRLVATVHVSTNELGAEVLVDGNPVDLATLPTYLYLAPGRHVLEARAGAGLSARRSLTVEAGKAYSTNLTLQPQPDKAASHSDSGSAPTALADPRLEPVSDQGVSGNRNWTPVIIASGVAVAAVGVGFGFNLDANAASDDAVEALRGARAQFGSNPCSPVNASSGACQDLASAQEHRDRSDAIAKVSFVVGGLAAAGAVAAYLFWPKDESPKAAIAPGAQVGPDGAALMLEGRF